MDNTCRNYDEGRCSDDGRIRIKGLCRRCYGRYRYRRRCESDPNYKSQLSEKQNARRRALKSTSGQRKPRRSRKRVENAQLQALRKHHEIRRATVKRHRPKKS